MSNERTLLWEEEIKTRWGDMDSLGHVNNAVYLSYFEQARTGWFDSLRKDGGSVTGADPNGPVLVHTSCTYLRPVHHPARLLVRLYGEGPGRSSFGTSYEVRDADDPEILYTTGDAKIVWIDFQSNRPIPVPEGIRALLPRAEAA
ncbi:thioesterase superfamily protein [Alkalilimnicola ehrlichii]|uniref:Thioesterase superfamily protein n=1 Tax=Alkalilimnicola ehrlichii TaxID=351052 RepID=A0A3E0WFI4_9GAMM|nr:thioesterase family protein [Alkalilimnicola ehrlichii]RFA26185.1 thioesterase superfamily protein [Alkalilimnicola ehrlichii]RFA31704.1 thioesterase superfamily protein [Alkalilimnicola ehrlichii]